jgi:hypothetical protein
MACWNGKINSGLAPQTKILNIHSNIKLQYLIKQDDKSLLNEKRIEIDSSCTLQTVLEHPFKKKKNVFLKDPAWKHNATAACRPNYESLLPAQYHSTCALQF